MLKKERKKCVRHDARVIARMTRVFYLNSLLTFDFYGECNRIINHTTTTRCVLDVLAYESKLFQDGHANVSAENLTLERDGERERGEKNRF